MKIFSFLLSFCFALSASGALASEAPLRVVKPIINAEAEDAEICLQFDKALSSTSPAQLAANLKLETGGEIVHPANIAAADQALCLFPLDRGKLYHLNIKGAPGAGDSLRIAPYKLSFTIPDRPPSLNFTGKNGAPNDFGAYGHPLALRAVNVPRAKIEVYRLAEPGLMASAWLNRAQTALVPTESAYLARTKGKVVWREEKVFDAIKNATSETRLSLQEKMPDLESGLYLIVADSEKTKAKGAAKGLAPLAAAWFVKTDASIRAVRDDTGVTAMASNKIMAVPKEGVAFEVYSRDGEKKAEAQSGADGLGYLPYSGKLRDKSQAAAVIAKDASGNVAFADIEDLPVLSGNGAGGAIRVAQSAVVPLSMVEASIVLPVGKNFSETGFLRLSKDGVSYADIPVPPFASTAKVLFHAPAKQGVWSLQLRKTDGAIWAEDKLLVSANPDAPRIIVSSQRDVLAGDDQWSVSIKSLLSSGKPAPLISGKIYIGWQKLDASAVGWKGYAFGDPSVPLPPESRVADFVTDLEGAATINLVSPPRPAGQGLYEAVLKVVTEADAGIAVAPPLVIPVRPQDLLIGVKPLAPDARFSQNGLAQFSLIGLAPDNKPRDVSGLSYQIYEEGRSFSWYQHDGRWSYKPEAQLRPLGGGALSLKADGSTVVEWPVNAGNYRIEVLGADGKTLAQSAFSAGWNAKGALAQSARPLKVVLPKTLQPGREAKAFMTLPEPSVIRAVVADSRVRLVLHEFRDKGVSAIAFTPAADWGKAVSLSVEALPQGGQGDAGLFRTVVESVLAESAEIGADTRAANLALIVPEDPSALLLDKNAPAVVTFGLQNNGPLSEKIRLFLTGSSGLKIESGTGNGLMLDKNQSLALPVALSGLSYGTKELRLEIAGAHASRLLRAWPLAVMPEEESFQSADAVALKPKRTLKQTPLKAKEESAILVSRRPMKGLAEILAFVFYARPFTTEELALTVEALKTWEFAIDQIGMAPAFAAAARRQSRFAQLLGYQNPDGGFGPLRDSESTMEDTAFALEALSVGSTESGAAAKNLAISWLKQRLANTWFEEKERNSRAAAYAALARAEALDAASLHYFSDVSATSALSPKAHAQLAAAFKKTKDPNAAAFWIKKMLSDHGQLRTPSVLSALAQTDALSSDDVLATMAETAEGLHRGERPSLKEAASLLGAIAANNINAGKSKLSSGSESRDFWNIFVLRGGDPALPNYQNADSDMLYLTAVHRSAPAKAAPRAGVVMRRIYRMNGVELQLPAKPIKGEAYLIGLEGKIPPKSKGKALIVQDGGNGLRPKGCALSKQLNALSFIPWFTAANLTKTYSCVFSAHHIGFAVLPVENDETVSAAYFGFIDGDPATLPLPEMRVLE